MRRSDSLPCRDGMPVLSDFIHRVIRLMVITFPGALIFDTIVRLRDSGAIE